MKFKILLILVCIAVVSVTGSINDLNSSDNSSGSRINQNYENQYDSNGSSNSSLKPVHYEASGYCSHVVDGDTIDVDGVGRISWWELTHPRGVSPDIRMPRILLRVCALEKQFISMWMMQKTMINTAEPLQWCTLAM
jgi:hypothetical protein